MSDTENSFKFYNFVEGTIGILLTLVNKLRKEIEDGRKKYIKDGEDELVMKFHLFLKVNKKNSY